MIDEAELAFLNSLISFAHQMMSLRLTDSQLALLCALVLVNPSECLSQRSCFIHGDSKQPPSVTVIHGDSKQPPRVIPVYCPVMILHCYIANVMPKPVFM